MQHLLVLLNSTIFAELLKRLNSLGGGGEEEKKKKRKKNTLAVHNFLLNSTKKLAPEVLKGEYFSACADSCSPKPCLAHLSCAREGSDALPCEKHMRLDGWEGKFTSSA